jgi:hypothetical protein
MFWGIAVFLLIVVGLICWLEDGNESGAWAALCGVLLLILGIIAICNGQIAKKTDYVTDIAGVGKLTKVTTHATGLRAVITFPFEVSDSNYTLDTEKGQVTIDQSDAEKLLATKK